VTYHKIKALSVSVVCDASATCEQCSNGYRKTTGIALSATSSRVSNLEHVQLVKGLSDIRLSLHYCRLGPGPLQYHCILQKELFPLPPLGGRSKRYPLARVVFRPQLSHCFYDSRSLRTASPCPHASTNSVARELHAIPRS
jgi:hypothetical protein